ncbi:hypothetical protein RhiXN_05463 [Rhizoctonia solani]|uniref:Uncharacterized protein n=1 Tax=Rhizoctonia solani TaxID=456999 RepID=A0A8H8NPA3_9AGAM|nr:uncharacterized protein RhiXN_05463 [Rhizoctonia solani]QRW17461.1 hypothetical protein RhiXN_05463 [Rhizoctonia solani]
MFHLTLTRLFAIFLAVAACATVVFAAPVRADNLMTRGGVCTEKCSTGEKVVEELSKLRSDVKTLFESTRCGLLLAITISPSKLIMDDPHSGGTNPAGKIEHIVSLFKESSSRIANMDKDQTGELNGQAETIRNLLSNIEADAYGYIGEAVSGPLTLPNPLGEALGNGIKDPFSVLKEFLRD